jgi:protein PhnA
MSVKEELLARSGSVCELCGSPEELSVYEVAPSDGSAEQSILICAKCKEQLENLTNADIGHWRCLSDSMWSSVPAVQVAAYRILREIATDTSGGWAQDLLDMLYLEEDVKAWADAESQSGDDGRAPTLDSNGSPLQSGDTVTIIKDLEVKGAGFTAKRGTAVRNIALTDNPEQIEGRVNGVRIVLLSKYLKKA